MIEELKIFVDEQGRKVIERVPITQNLNVPCRYQIEFFLLQEIPLRDGRTEQKQVPVARELHVHSVEEAFAAFDQEAEKHLTEFKAALAAQQSKLIIPGMGGDFSLQGLGKKN